MIFRSTGGHHIFPKGYGKNIKGRKLGIDEDKFRTLDPSPIHEDEQSIAVKKMSNDEIRIGPITRALQSY